MQVHHLFAHGWSSTSTLCLAFAEVEFVSEMSPPYLYQTQDEMIWSTVWAAHHIYTQSLICHLCTEQVAHMPLGSAHSHTHSLKLVQSWGFAVEPWISSLFWAVFSIQALFHLTSLLKFNKAGPNACMKTSKSVSCCQWFASSSQLHRYCDSVCKQKPGQIVQSCKRRDASGFGVLFWIESSECGSLR